MRSILSKWPWMTLAALLFAAWSALLARWWPHTPRAVLATSHSGYSHSVWLRGISPDGSVLVSDWIITGVTPDSGTDFWDLDRGVRIPSPFAAPPEWQSPAAYGADRVLWDPERFATFRAWYERDLLPVYQRAQRAVRPNEEPSDLLPRDAQFSLSGRHFFYAVNARCRPANPSDAHAWADYFRLAEPDMVVLPRMRYHPKLRLDIMVHDAASGRELGALRDSFWPLAFSPDGKHALCWGYRAQGEVPEELVIWDLHSAREQGRLRVQWDSVSTVVLPRGSETLFELDAGPDWTIKVLEWWKQTGCRTVAFWNENFPRVVQPPRYHSPRYFCQHRSERIEGHCIWVWDVTTGRRAGVWEPKWPLCLEQYAALCTSADGSVIAVECRQCGVGGGPFQRWPWLQRQWDKSNPPPADGYRIVTVIDAATLAEIATVPGHHPLLSPDGRRLVTMSPSGSAVVWDVPARPPWARVFLTAGFLTLSSLLAVLATAKLGRSLGRFVRRQTVARKAAA